MYFVNGGISGTTLQREGLQKMQKLVEDEQVGTIIVKELNRFGREQAAMEEMRQNSQQFRASA